MHQTLTQSSKDMLEILWQREVLDIAFWTKKSKSKKFVLLSSDSPAILLNHIGSVTGYYKGILFIIRNLWNDELSQNKWDLQDIPVVLYNLEKHLPRKLELLPIIYVLAQMLKLLSCNVCLKTD